MLPNIPLSTFADLASTAGLLVALIGFGITIVEVRRSRKAARQAARAAERAREAFLKSRTIADFSSAITGLAEIRRLHRLGAWTIVTDRYSALRQLLIAVSATNQNLGYSERASITGAIQHLRDMEHAVDKALASDSTPPDGARLNSILTTQADKLTGLLEAIKIEP